jgi:hypothetical protein
MARADLTGCLVRIYRGRQKGVEGIVIHQDEHSLMITASDLSGTENWYERTANVKILVKEVPTPAVCNISYA